MEKVILKNGNSRLELNLNFGGQIEKLLLKVPNKENLVSVIKPFQKDQNFFLSGNFIMYPWVNRLEDTDISIDEKKISIQALTKDSNGYLIHGLYFNTARRVLEMDTNSVTIEPITINPNFPNFTETFLLEENQLIIRTTFFNPTSDIQSFSYGYHPYLQISENIDTCKIFTNFSEYIPLTFNLLPNSNLETKPISELFSTENKMGNLKLDHLLKNNSSEPYFGIINEEQNLKLQVKGTPNSEIPLIYFQVYTPEDRKSIAIEPMSSTGNVFFTKNSGLYKLNPNEKKIGEFKIELEKFY